jgi:hypothetical protein
MKRREFIKTGSGGLLGAAFLPSVLLSQENYVEVDLFQKAISLFSNRISAGIVLHNILQTRILNLSKQ